MTNLLFCKAAVYARYILRNLFDAVDAVDARSPTGSLCTSSLNGPDTPSNRLCNWAEVEELEVRAVTNRKCDCGQGDLPLVPCMDIHRRAKRGRRDGLRLMLVPGHARCDKSVATSGSAEVVECGASAVKTASW